MSIDLSPPTGYSASNLVFSDNFLGNTLGPAWNTFMSGQGYGVWFGDGAGGSAVGGSGNFQADYNLPSHVTVNNGLTLTATPDPHTGPDGTRYPYTSGIVSTDGKLEFTGGYVQVSMKEAGGAGAWPAIWMLPTGSGHGAAEIDIQEGGFLDGSVPPNDVMAASFHAADGSSSTTLTNAGTDLSTGFHTYGLDWRPGQSLTWYLDGRQVKQVTGSSVPSTPMELIIDNDIANGSAASWRTTYDNSTPNPLATSVNDVQIYQNNPSESITGGSINNPPPPPPPTGHHHHHWHDLVAAAVTGDHLWQSLINDGA